MDDQKNETKKTFTISEFREELKLPLVLAKKLIVWGEIEVERAVDGTIRITEEGLLTARRILENRRQRTMLFIKGLGPGLITGASDDDPSGIGTYSSVGAKFGYAIIWMAPWLLPLMIAVQECCARIGIVTNKGLSAVLQKRYKRKFVAILVLLLLIANIVNIGADIQAMAASIELVVNVNFFLIAIFLTLLIIAIEIFIPYRNYVKILKWLTISLFAYFITAFIIHPPWLHILKELIVPNIYFNKEYLFAVVAVFGTTISPYLFFWQTSEEVEEIKKQKKDRNHLAPRKERIAQMRTDVDTGMIFANLAFMFVVITTTHVLFENGIKNIASAQEAALALKPLAGNYAFLLFAFGIVGTGLLAVPILAGSGAYALSELLNWREGLEKKFSRAKGFYIVILVSILIGFLMNFIGLNPITALYWAAFLNGVIAVPLLFVIMIIGGDKKIMGRETHPRLIKIFGWTAFAFSFLAVVTTLVLFLFK